jgi:hypothetical protein
MTPVGADIIVDRFVQDPGNVASPRVMLISRRAGQRIYLGPIDSPRAEPRDRSRELLHPTQSFPTLKLRAGAAILRIAETSRFSFWLVWSSR